MILFVATLAQSFRVTLYLHIGPWCVGMAALIELAIHQAAEHFEAPADDRHAPPWPTDFAQKRGVYTPSRFYKPVKSAVKGWTPMPWNMSQAVYTEYVQAGGVHSRTVQPTHAGTRMLEGLVPEDSIPSNLRGFAPIAFSNEDVATATDLLNLHSAEYRRARLETMLWRKPTQAASIVHLMDQISLNRKRTAQHNRDQYARRVQARMDFHVPTALTAAGVAMDYP